MFFNSYHRTVTHVGSERKKVKREVQIFIVSHYVQGKTNIKEEIVHVEQKPVVGSDLLGLPDGVVSGRIRTTILGPKEQPVHIKVWEVIR